MFTINYNHNGQSVTETAQDIKTAIKNIRRRVGVEVDSITWEVYSEQTVEFPLMVIPQPQELPDTAEKVTPELTDGSNVRKLEMVSEDTYKAIKAANKVGAKAKFYKALNRVKMYDFEDVNEVRLQLTTLGLTENVHFEVDLARKSGYQMVILYLK